MRIDAYTHFFPKKFFDKLRRSRRRLQGHGQARAFAAGAVRPRHRKKIVDGHKDYQQILSYPQPPIENFAKSPARDRRVHPPHQRRLCRTVRQGEGPLPRLGGANLARCARCRRRARRSARSRSSARSACRSTPTSPASRSTGRNIVPFWKKMNELGKPVWLHPARGAEHAGLHRREEIALRNLVDVRLVLRDRDRHGAPGVLQDHGQPSRTSRSSPTISAASCRCWKAASGRAGTCWARAPATRITSSLRKSLKKRPLDYFKQDFYADTAVFGGVPATKCGLEFFPLDKIVFASDCPFDPEGGTMYPRVTLQILEFARTFPRPTATRSTSRISKPSPA